MRASERGFTLIEVMVALVVSALLLATVFEASGLAMARLRRTEEKRQALIQGSYLLATRSVEDFSDAPRSGTVGGLHWASDEQAVSTDPRKLLVLARVHVIVADAGRTVLFEHSALRLKALPQ
jgi:prepilin-type N-terminal cleavage/methylation domain-containing protein